MIILRMHLVINYLAFMHKHSSKKDSGLSLEISNTRAFEILLLQVSSGLRSNPIYRINVRYVHFRFYVVTALCLCSA